MGPNARFGYPLKGGFEALMKGFMPHIKGTVETSAKVVQLIPQEKLVALADGRRFHYEQLVSTMPLPELVKVIGANAPAEVHQAAQGLRHISIRCVNLGIARENITDKHWIYYPEDSIFHRIFVQGNASPHCNPPGGFGLTCEISYSEHKPLPLDGDALVQRCMEDLVKVGLLQPDDKLITSSLVDMPYAYVLYDHARSRNVELIRRWMAQHDIVLAGRYSEWEYYNSDHAFLAGLFQASRSSGDALCQLHPGRRIVCNAGQVLRQQRRQHRRPAGARWCGTASDKFIFSSTAAIFGDPQYVPIDEAHPKAPINPVRPLQADGRADPGRLRPRLRPASVLPALLQRGRRRPRWRDGRMPRARNPSDPAGAAGRVRTARGDHYPRQRTTTRPTAPASATTSMCRTCATPTCWRWRRCWPAAPAPATTLATATATRSGK
jgi:hypothetical protein